MLRAFLLTLLPASAMAQDTAAAATGGSPYASLLPLVMIFVVFYFLLIKPQQKRMKDHQAVLSGLKKGDEVVTGGGIIGRITKVDDTRATIEIAKGIEVVALKSTISALAGEPAVVVTKPASGKKNPAVKNDNVVLKKEQIANDN